MPNRSDLISLLTSYHPSDEAEQRYLIAMADLAAVAHDPFDRSMYEPGHFTASAFVIHPQGRAVLLIHHARLGIWVQPGGHIDPEDDTPLSAAIREVSEEVGLKNLEPVGVGLVDVDIHEYPDSGDQPRHLHHDLRFAFVAREGRLVANREVIEAAWVEPSGIEALGVDISVTRPVAKLLGGG